MSFSTCLANLNLNPTEFEVFSYKNIIYNSYKFREIRKKYFFEIRVYLCFRFEKLKFIKLQEEKFLALIKSDWSIGDRKGREKLDNKTVLIDLIGWTEYNADQVESRVKQAVNEFCSDLARINMEVKQKTITKKQQTFEPYSSISLKLESEQGSVGDRDFKRSQFGVFREIDRKCLRETTGRYPVENFPGFVIVNWNRPGCEGFETHFRKNGEYVVVDGSGVDLQSEGSLVDGFYKKIYPDARSGFSSLSTAYNSNPN